MASYKKFKSFWITCWLTGKDLRAGIGVAMSVYCQTVITQCSVNISYTFHKSLSLLLCELISQLVPIFQFSWSQCFQLPWLQPATGFLLFFQHCRSLPVPVFPVSFSCMYDLIQRWCFQPVFPELQMMSAFPVLLITSSTSVSSVGDHRKPTSLWLLPVLPCAKGRIVLTS